MVNFLPHSTHSGKSEHLCLIGPFHLLVGESSELSESSNLRVVTTTIIISISTEKNFTRAIKLAKLLFNGSPPK